MQYETEAEMSADLTRDDRTLDDELAKLDNEIESELDALKKSMHKRS